jgi:hypothetical protein
VQAAWRLGVKCLARNPKWKVSRFPKGSQSLFVDRVKAVRIYLDGMVWESAVQVYQNGMQQGEIANIPFKVGADHRY